MADDGTSNDTSDPLFSSSSLIPVSSDGERLVYNNNKATIPGLLYEHGLWCIRNGYFQHLLKYRAALVKFSLAIDDYSACYFIVNPDGDPRDGTNRWDTHAPWGAYHRCTGAI